MSNAPDFQEAGPPSADLALLIVNHGASYLRWLVSIYRAVGETVGIDGADFFQRAYMRRTKYKLPRCLRGLFGHALFTFLSTISLVLIGAIFQYSNSEHAAYLGTMNCSYHAAPHAPPQ